jgi:hypothetical protein
MFQNRKELGMNEKELAIRECYYLWKLLARTGSWDKPKSVSYLYGIGKLHKSDYTYSCPLCEFVRTNPDQVWIELDCDRCPIYWPNTEGKYGEERTEFFCCGSYFGAWEFSEDPKFRPDRKRLAADICGLIEEQYPEITKEVNQDEFIRSLER